MRVTSLTMTSMGFGFGSGQRDDNLLIQVDYLAHPVIKNMQNTPHNQAK